MFVTRHLLQWKFIFVAFLLSGFCIEVACSPPESGQEKTVIDSGAVEKTITSEIEAKPESQKEASGGEKPSDKGGEDNRPPKICKFPKGGSGAFFKDISKQVGVQGVSSEPLGNRLSAADLDGDGYIDLFVHHGSARRDKLTAKPSVRYRWVLMNRPDPKDPKKRRFVDMTKKSGYTQTLDKFGGRAANFAIFADIDNDGHVDVFSSTWLDATKPLFLPRDRDTILLNDGKAHFRLISKKTDVKTDKSKVWPTTGATFLDYNKDGNIDLFVGYWYARYGTSYEGVQDRLFEGKGDGTFVDVTSKVGLETKSFAAGYKDGTNHRPTMGVTSCDIDGDGNSDLIVSVYGRQWNMLYLNKGGKFQNVAKSLGFDGDKNHNLNDHQFYLCHCKLHPNDCPKNIPAPRIRCPSRSYFNKRYDGHPFRMNGNTFTTVCGDINNDGRMDLYNTEIRHWHVGQSSDPTQLILNFIDSGKTMLKRMPPAKVGMARSQTGSWNQGDLTAAFWDFDNDGRPDIYLSNSDYPSTQGSLFQQSASSTALNPAFKDVAALLGVAHKRSSGLVVVDIDRDGDLDLIVGSSRMRCKASEGCPWKKSSVFVYENLRGNEANWLQIQLRGKGSGGANKMGIGARIRVTAGGVTQTQEISGGYGHSGLHHGLTAHFGLGKSCEIDKIEIRWPNKKNTIQVFKNVRANYRIVIEEGKAEIKYLKNPK